MRMTIHIPKWLIRSLACGLVVGLAGVMLWVVTFAFMGLMLTVGWTS